MRLLITGICGFVGASLARELRATADYEIIGIDNLMRPGSHLNRADLLRLGIKIWHGDIRNSSDLEGLPRADWVIDAAAAPSVLAGADGLVSSRQLLEHNLQGTLNLLEYCKRHAAGFVILSTSRVYSIAPLAALPLEEVDQAYRINPASPLPHGVSPQGVAETFSTAPPISLYGASKLCSETLALEYSDLFQFPVWIDRCGVMAGAGQFGRADQGIFSFWVHSWNARRPLKYIGFNGRGFQVRDALHPRDLVVILRKQLAAPSHTAQRIFNVAGGPPNSASLARLSDWCARRFGPHQVASDPAPRRFDVPWLILDSSKAHEVWNWSPRFSLDQILEEIAVHAEQNPDWLNLTGS